MAVAHGLKVLELPTTLVEAALSSLMAPLDDNSDHCLCVSLDAESNLSRTTGVAIFQIAPYSEPDSVFIIHVHKI